MAEINIGRKVSCLAFSPSGDRLVAGTFLGSIEIITTSNYKVAHSFLGHQSRVTDIEFNPVHHEQIATGSHDRTVRLWLLSGDTKNEPIKLEVGSVVKALEFSADGALIHATGDDGSIHTYYSNAAILSEKLCPYIKTKLTKQELKQYIEGEIRYSKPNCVSEL